MNTALEEIKERETSEIVTKGFLRDYMDYKFALFNEESHRHIMMIMEDNQHKHDQLIESFKIQYEMFARYTDGNEEDKEKIHSRLNRLESKVLLA